MTVVSTPPSSSADPCLCPCHAGSRRITHITPCCIICPVCLQAVRFGAAAAHEKRHTEEENTNNDRTNA